MTATLIVLAALAQQPTPPAPPDDFKPDPAWKSLGQDLWFDPAGRRLVMRAKVVLRDGFLEHLLCSTDTKEHESILATGAPPRQIHAGLLLTGAETGHPVRFRPRFEPPAGSPIAIEMEWTEAGKARKADARTWVIGNKTNKPLDRTWVFAGSVLFQDPETKETLYSADEGDLITVANFPSAILDLPFASSDSDANRDYLANTEKLPPLGARVTMYLKPEPVPPAAKP